jgi:hypothetical protein
MWRERLKEERANCLTVYYEDLFDERSLTKKWEANEGAVVMPREAAQNISNFLGVEYQDLHSYLKRVNTPDYHNYILNWEEIKDLAGIKAG